MPRGEYHGSDCVRRKDGCGKDEDTLTTTVEKLKQKRAVGIHKEITTLSRKIVMEFKKVHFPRNSKNKLRSNNNKRYNRKGYSELENYSIIQELEHCTIPWVRLVKADP